MYMYIDPSICSRGGTYIMKMYIDPSSCIMYTCIMYTCARVRVVEASTTVKIWFLAADSIPSKTSIDE